MSKNISPRQAMQNDLVPLACISITFAMTVLFGRDIWAFLLRDDVYDEWSGLLAWLIMTCMLGVVLITGLTHFVRSYKKYVAWKNAPPAPAKPVPPATSDLSDLPVARTAQRMQNDATNPPTSASTMYQAAPVHARAVPSPAPQVIEKEKVIIKEVIKVRCGWCGTLVDQGMAECPHCAGRL